MRATTIPLNDSDPDDPETARVPRFDEALALAAELGMMLYVDQKTDRSELVHAVIADGSYYEVALLRNDLASIIASHEVDQRLLVMPAIENEQELQQALAQITDLTIVEVALFVVNPELVTAILAAGLKAQQDVMVMGDIMAQMQGDYSAWREFVDAGVILLQTELPELLVPAVKTYNATGVFPD